MGSTCLEWAEYNPVWPYVGRVTDNCGAKSREVLPAQPVDATPSAINLFTKGGVHDASETGKAYRDAEERHVGPLEGRTVVA